MDSLAPDETICWYCQKSGAFPVAFQERPEVKMFDLCETCFTPWGEALVKLT